MHTPCLDFLHCVSAVPKIVPSTFFSLLITIYLTALELCKFFSHNKFC